MFIRRPLMRSTNRMNVKSISIIHVKLISFFVLLLCCISRACTNGYIDISPFSKFCFLIPYLPNIVIDENLNAENRKTWNEAEAFCNANGGGRLAIFESEYEFNILTSYLRNIYVIREMFRDHTNVLGIYVPGEPDLCPNPTIGCSIWYFGLRRYEDNKFGSFRYSNIYVLLENSYYLIIMQYLERQELII